MSIKDNKNLIGNIVIIISIILVASCIYMLFSEEHEQMYNTEHMNWNGFRFTLSQGLVCEESNNDSFKLVGKYSDKQNIQCNKTTDLTRYNKFIRNGKNAASIEINNTHKLIKATTDDGAYAAIIPIDAINGTYKNLTGTPTIYEFTCKDEHFLLSFLMSAIHSSKSGSSSNVDTGNSSTGQNNSGVVRYDT